MGKIGGYRDDVIFIVVGILKSPIGCNNSHQKLGVI